MKVAIRFALALCTVIIFSGLTSLPAAADEGSLDPAQPKGTTVEEIIRRFAAKEKEFKEARDQYTFRQTVKVQTVDGNTVTGEYQETFDVLFDDKAKRLENVVYAPQSTLENGGISMSPEDVDDIRHSQGRAEAGGEHSGRTRKNPPPPQSEAHGGLHHPSKSKARSATFRVAFG